MNIPTFFHTQSRLFGEIIKITENTSNDMDLGKTIRSIIGKYKNGEFEPPSPVQFDDVDDDITG